MKLAVMWYCAADHYHCAQKYIIQLCNLPLKWQASYAKNNIARAAFYDLMGLKDKVIGNIFPICW